MKDEEIDKMADDFVNAQEFTKVYGTARKAECGAFWKDGFLAGLKAGRQWHKVSEQLPEMDVLVYLWDKVDNFPVVARRHIPYGQKEWVWDCRWGSGFALSQAIGEDYLWKELVLPELQKGDWVVRSKEPL